MTVCDGEDPDIRIADDVGDVIREYLEIESAIATGPKAWHLAVTLDPTDVAIYFFPKPQPQATELPFVVRDGIHQLGASFGEELDLHREGKRPAISFLICS